MLQYVAKYEENVSPGMIASVPSQGNEQMAATLLQLSQSQAETILEDHDVSYDRRSPSLHNTEMEGDNCSFSEGSCLTISILQEMTTWSVT